MSLQYGHLQKRVLSVLVAIPIVIMAIYWSPWTYFLFFLTVVILAMLEFYRLANLGGVSPQKHWGMVGGIFSYTLVFIHAMGYIPGHYLYMLCLVIALIFPIALYHKSITPFTDIAYTLLGIVYVSGPLTLLHIIAFTNGTYSQEIIMGILLILWAHDTGAYLVGSSIGKRRLFQRISPNKSWEGTLGGAPLALVVSYRIANYFRVLDLETWLGVGSIIVVAGTYGDLVESMFKRSLNIKDSGAIIPGHGGILDRFDSFLLASPFILILIKLLH